MKVFSLDKFRNGPGTEAAKEGSIEQGWPIKLDGKEQSKCGSFCSEDWFVEKEEWLASHKESTASIKGSKLEYHLLPPEQLAGMAQIMNNGVKTHETGYMDLDPLLYWNATMRHLMALRSGETTDEEGNSHALAIACNGMILDRQLKAGKELRFER